ncbi:MAG: tRNA (adenosine(37)-N6)-dimethylallyltransferase MiaA [Nitrospirota bacterium]
MSFPRPLLCIAGPTASGKSAVAYALARRWATDVIIADSRQLYRGMPIGTDQPPPEWQAAVTHHLLGVAAPDDPWNAGRFCRAAEPVIAGLHRQGRIPIIVGGTGLYLRALLYGLTPGPPADPAIRRELAERIAREGLAALHAWLTRVDPSSAAAIAPADEPKIIRALEFYLSTGKPRSAWHAEHGFRTARYDHLLIGLRLPRAVLHRRIELRVAAMAARGLAEEVRGLWTAGYDERHQAMRGLGYRQLLRAFRGECSTDEAIGETIRETKRYAKRQMTWFRGQPDLQWLDVTGEEPPGAAAEAIDRMARQRWAECAIIACANGPTTH